MRGRSPDYRWMFVAVAAMAMGAAGTYQFVWSSLSGAVATRIPASETELGTVFTLFVVAQTLVQLPAGSFRDRFGPRKLLPLSGLLMFGGYVGTAFATSMLVVYASYVLGGIGAGISYTVAINTPVKWFTDRRGLATGIVAMMFSGVSVVAIPFIRGFIETAFTPTLLALGVAVGVMTALGGLVIRDPETSDENGGLSVDDPADGDLSGSDPPPERPDERPSVGWRTAIRTRQFWVIYAVSMVVNGVGLMLISRSVNLTTELGLGAAVATTVASVIALADGAGVLVVSGLSDRFGEERTAGVSLLVCGAALAGAIAAANQSLPSMFVILTGMTAFFRSPVFSIFPALVGRYYGPARSSQNYAAIYTSKIPGGVFGGTVSGILVASIGWSMSFYLGAAIILLAGLATLSLRATTVRERIADTVDS
ncbi:MAG: MFS transporter [Halobacteriota archaeon]